jgi:hypothetical protein
VNVKTSFLTKEELERIRTGAKAKCDLDKRPPKRKVNWEWPKKKKAK